MTSRPVQCPRTSVCGFATAASIRAVIAFGVGAQLGVHAGDDDVEPAEQLVGLVEAAVVVDVELDAGEDPERRELLVERGDDVELLLQPLRRSARWRRSAAASGR